MVNCIQLYYLLHYPICYSHHSIYSYHKYSRVHFQIHDDATLCNYHQESIYLSRIALFHQCHYQFSHDIIPGTQRVAEEGEGRPNTGNIQASLWGILPKLRGINEGHQWGRRIPFGQCNERYWRGARAPRYGIKVQQLHRLKTNGGG